MSNAVHSEIGDIAKAPRKVAILDATVGVLSSNMPAILAAFRSEEHTSELQSQ